MLFNIRSNYNRSFDKKIKNNVTFPASLCRPVKFFYRIRHLPFLSADSVAAPPDELAFLSPEDSFLLLPFLEEQGEDNSSSSANLIYHINIQNENISSMRTDCYASGYQWSYLLVSFPSAEDAAGRIARGSSSRILG